MRSTHRTVEQTAGATVADVMLPHPKTLPADATVADLRRLFALKPSVRTALLVEGPVFRASLDRGDLPAEARDDEPALRYARDGDTIAPGASVADALERLAALDEPRLVVLDENRLLRGLVCLSGNGSQFCVA